ncbi:hypothetical protein Q0M01_14585, partial [Staphylococcus aureus]|nr:hypothetical protein [Staphylococcus aureus]
LHFRRVQAMMTVRMAAAAVNPLLRPAPEAAETDQAVMAAAGQMTEMNLQMVQTAGFCLTPLQTPIIG